jgi:membrane protein involved in colicin uptake
MEEEDKPKMTYAMRYYRLHREERLAKKREERENKPEIIAKREAREQKKAEREAAKEAEKEARRQEKERIRQEHASFAFETSKKKEKLIEKGGLDAILGRLSSGI